MIYSKQFCNRSTRLRRLSSKIYSRRLINPHWREGVQRRVAEEIKRQGLDICLKESRVESLTKAKGKIRDVYDLGDKLLFITTDRLSAFDRYLCSCPFKGQVVNQTSAWWFDKTSEIVPNAVIAVPDPNALLMKKTNVFPIEFVVRAYMTGTTNTSLWTNYNRGAREYCGHVLPEGLSKNDALKEPIVTPTTKSDVHDELISGKEIIDRGFMTAEDWETTCSLALKLFKYGQGLANQKDLILVDTKYEFGKDEEGNILLIDEIHTPDSSRFWIQSSYEDRRLQGEDPDNFDKEFIRRWYTSQCDPYKTQILPTIPEDLLIALASRYVFLYEAMTDQEFVMSEVGGEMDINSRICQNVKKWI